MGYPKPGGATRRRFFAICEKPQGELSGRGLTLFSSSSFQLFTLNPSGGGGGEGYSATIDISDPATYCIIRKLGG